MVHAWKKETRKDDAAPEEGAQAYKNFISQLLCKTVRKLLQEPEFWKVDFTVLHLEKRTKTRERSSAYANFRVPKEKENLRISNVTKLAWLFTKEYEGLACKKGQFDTVEVIVNKIRILVSIWMFKMWMEWLSLIWKVGKLVQYIF